MSDMLPTMNLRFVEREVTSKTNSDGSLLPADVVRVFKAKVLQQQFVSVVSRDHEWRDVPLVDLGA